MKGVIVKIAGLALHIPFLSFSPLRNLSRAEFKKTNVGEQNHVVGVASHASGVASF